MRSMKLDSIISSFMQVLRGVRKSRDNVFDLVNARSMRLSEAHSHDIALKLHITGGYWVGVDVLSHLTSRM